MSLPNHFRKLVATELVPDFRSATQIVEAALVQPSEDQVLVRNLYMGVNGSDPVAVCGGYGIMQPPFDLGLDSGGEVVAVGPDVAGIHVGDQAVVFAFGGGYGEYRLASAAQVYVMPTLTAQLMSAFIPALTASVGFGETGVLKSGETVLITAAAGGVGSYAVQLAKLSGNHVIGTTGSEEKAAWLRKLGCDRVINYRTEDLDTVLASEYPKGIDVVFETVGRSTFDIALKHLALFGRLLSIGATAEYGNGVSWEKMNGVRVYQPLLARSATIAASTLAAYPRAVWIRHLDRVVSLLAEGRIKPVLDETLFMGLESVVDAVEHMQAGRNIGKIVVRL